MRLVISVIFVFTILQLSSQTPIWVNFQSRKFNYPDSEYLTGFSSAKIESRKTIVDQIKVLENYARNELIESINVTVSSENFLKTQEVLQTKRRNNSYYESYSSKTVTKANTDVVGLIIENHRDTRNRELYAFAYVRKDDLIQYYNSLFDSNKEKVSDLISEASNYKTNGRNSLALNCYRDCLPLLSEMGKSSSVIVALTKDQSQSEIVELSSQVRKGLEEVKNIKASSLGDATDILADELYNSIKNRNIAIQVFPFTYQDSRQAGEFSGVLLSALKQSTVQKGFSVVTDVSKYNSQSSAAVLTGNYWEENNQVRLIGTITNNEGRVLASAESVLSKDWLNNNNISWLPEKFKEAGERLKLFAKDEIIGGGLNLELWTNKGDENLLYREGDTLKLFVRANQECYLRFVYYLADGSKVLLMDDYYIGSNLVNKVIQLPEIFTCTSPFGNELLVLNGQTEEFPPLNIREQYGYKFILDDTETVVARTRGFKPLNNQMLNGEKKLVINTIK